MGNQLAIAPDECLTIDPHLVDQTRANIDAATSPATRRAYRAGWRMFSKWCADHSLAFLPASPQTLAIYLTHLAEAGKKVATIEGALSAISQAHELAGHESPRKTAIIRKAMRGIRRTVGAPQTRKSPLVVDLLALAVNSLSQDLRGLRDRAILVTGFAGAFRRSELAALHYSDLTFTSEGVRVLLRRSKTDQVGEGRYVALLAGKHEATNPGQVLRKWLVAAGITAGPVFRRITRTGAIGRNSLCGYSIAVIVQQVAKQIGLDPTKYAGHSLRSGFVTSAAHAGRPEHTIMRQTGHRSATVMHRYIREANLFRDHAAEGIGL